jgi:hypothetical protein
MHIMIQTTKSMNRRSTPDHAAHREPSLGWEDGRRHRKKDTGEFRLNDRFTIL